MFLPSSSIVACVGARALVNRQWTVALLTHLATRSAERRDCPPVPVQRHADMGTPSHALPIRLVNFAERLDTHPATHRRLADKYTLYSVSP